MAGQSITFDFLTRGADSTASGFRKVGDNTVLAARGAKVLSDAIESLGKKEDRTAAESALLAKALRQTGDAEDRMAARAVVADAAIRRLDDAIQEDKRDALEAAAANRTLGDSFSSLAKKASSPSLSGALAALSPALIPVAGGIAAGVAAVGVSFGAAALGAGLFAATAGSVLSGAADNLKKLQTLEQKANAARTPAAKKAADQQIAALKASWSAGYLDMLDALDKFKSRWTSVSQAIAVPALTAGIGALADGIGFLKPALMPVAAVFTQWGQTIDRYFKSGAGSAEMNRLAAAFGKFSASQLRAVGTFLVDVGKAVFHLGSDLAGHNVDFGTFGKHLETWGAAFLRWSQSGAARQDVSKFLAFIRASGPQLAGLLKNLGQDLALFAPGLASAGALELKVISAFLGLVAKLPPGLAKPLTEVAVALLTMSKLGVLKVGFQIVGAAAKWLTGGAISIGGGATAAAEMRGAFATGGAAAAAEIRAALAGGAAARGAGGAAGKAKAGLPVIAGIGPWAAATAGVIVGALARAVGDKLSPAGTFAGNLNKQFQADGHMWSTSLLHSFTFGGLEAWLTTKIGLPVGGFLNNLAAGAKIWGGNLTHTAVGAFGNIAGGAKTWWGNITGTVSGAWKTITGQSSAGSKAVAAAFGAAGRAADALRTRNLVPLLGQTGKVSGGVQGLAGMINRGLSPAMSTGGQHADAFRTRNLIPLRGELGRDSGGVQGLQHYIDLLHGKTVRVNFVGSGSGSIAFKESIPGVTTGPSSQGLLGFHAAGGMITGGTPGRDSVLGMLMPGEVVVPAHMVRGGAVDHLRGQLPGFAGGGVVSAGGTHTLSGITGPNGVLSAGQPYMAKAEAAFGRQVEAAFARAVIAKFKADMSSLGGSGSAIVNYARSFLGKIPYVMGGNSLSGGIDCSGFVQQVYGKFGIHAPRTSETQYAWATKSGPVPGGMAFYVSPAGGPPPGHVAIVQDASTVISQGGGMGPKLMGLHAMPLMGTGIPKGGFPASAGGGGNAAPAGALQAIAMSLLRQYGWGNQWGSFNALENREAGWNMTARNPSSGAYGLAQFINGPSEYFQYGGNPSTGLGQLTAMMNYIGQRYGSPNAAWGHELSAGWYGKGGLVPGYASGGQVSKQGAAWLKAWQTRHGGGFGAAWGPKVLNEQIPEMSAAMNRARTLAGAGGLSAAQHKHWAYVAAQDKKRLAVLNKELTTERAWRGQLGASDTVLTREIAAAGNIPSLRKNAAGWKAQLSRQKGTIGAISKMLGWSNAHLAANPPAPAANASIKHTYGGDVANNLGAVLASALGPFTGAARGGMIFDSGGTLRPGFNPVWNNTGRPESLVPARGGGGGVHLHLTVSGPVGSQQQLEDWFVRTANKAAQHGRLSQAVRAAGR